MERPVREFLFVLALLSIGLLLLGSGLPLPALAAQARDKSARAVKPSQIVKQSKGGGVILGVTTPTATPTPHHTTGMGIIKSCPAFASPGSTFNCTFSIQNRDDQHGIINLSVTNEA